MEHGLRGRFGRFRRWGAEEDNERTAMGWADALPPPINPTTIVQCIEAD